MAKMTPPSLNPGPRKDLSDALHVLHLRAGWPSARVLASDLGGGVASSSRVHDAFSKPRLPDWGLLDVLVTELARRARMADAEKEVERFHNLWEKATTESAPSPETLDSEEDVDAFWARVVAEAEADGTKEGPSGAGNAEADRDKDLNGPPVDDPWAKYDQKVVSQETRSADVEHLFSTAIKAAYAAREAWTEIGGHDDPFDPYAPAEEYFLDEGRMERDAFRTTLQRLQEKCTELAPYGAPPLKRAGHWPPTQEDLTEVIRSLQEIREQQA
ncbi:hypothetical protein [Streptomyces sp. 43Y-GA-1]|uniref:hypothetical protein n=1 Tax=Streptomyces sp. 43Y-GA-1 TaxID=2939435 RepID=UPI0020C0F2C0|nr:hypothetical protein [Streptomyces sp. 43Y-GA-1]MCL6293254.1 hypothetical protein [Streptomyces sp. 43Y-GA-1]